MQALESSEHLSAFFVEWEVFSTAMNIHYQLIRSDRKTIGLEIRNGELLVRAPLLASMAEIEQVLLQKQHWIDVHLAKSRKKIAQTASIAPLTPDELQELGQNALRYIPERVKYYASKMGLRVHSITIRNQRTRWGSCSSKGNLNFNCLLMLTPPEVIDSVVVHELCHLREMNHSPRFYAEVYKYFPDYDKWHSWLKEHQAELLARL